MDRMRTFAMAIVSSLIAAAGCDHSAAPAFEVIDTDSSTDTDADSDGDADSDTDVDCSANSGWPCICDDVELCDDGSRCVHIPDMGTDSGVCMVPCSGDEDATCLPTPYAADEECVVYSQSQSSWFCLLLCGDSDECPPQQVCRYEPNLGDDICYPPGSDTDTDSDSDSDTDTDADACEDAIVVPDSPALWEYEDNWSSFQEDTFDGSMQGCSNSGGWTAWFRVNVPPYNLLEVRRMEGATVGINFVDGCDADSCLTSGINAAIWENPGDDTETLWVAVETEFQITQATMHISFDRYDLDGDVCDDGIWMGGPYPESAHVEIADLAADEMPTGCGTEWGGQDAWFTVPIPAATQMTFTPESTSSTAWTTYFGYSTDCDHCEASATFQTWDTESFDYVNTSAGEVLIRAYIQDGTAATDGQYIATVVMTALPDGDTCVGAIGVDAGDLPYTWQSSNPLFNHSCAPGVCPGTSGPDVWHTLDVPAGDVLFIEKTAGPTAYFAVVDSCTAGEALAFHAGAEQRLVWQNLTGSAATVHAVAGAVAASDIGSMELLFDVRTPQPGQFCGSALPVPTGVSTWSDSGDWSDVADYWVGGDGCGDAEGPEVWYEVEIGAGSFLEVAETGDEDVTIQILDGCDVDGCIAAGEAGDLVTIVNPDDQPETVYVAIEAAADAPVESGWSATFGWGDPPAGDLCIDPIPIAAAEGSWSGDWSDYFDSETLDTGAGCGEASGRDVWLDVEVGVGEKLSIGELNGSIPAIVQVVTGCGDGDPCSSNGVDGASWYNDTGAAAHVVAAVEAYNANTSTGLIDVEMVREGIIEGDSCSRAIAVGSGDLPMSASPGLSPYGAAWPSYLCAPADGPDVWYSVVVPPGNVVSLSEGSAEDSVLYLTGSCPPVDCLASADEPEEVNWYNGTGDPVTVYAAARGATIAESSAVLDIDLDVAEPAQGDLCSHPLDITAQPMPFSWPGNLLGFSSSFAGQAADGCLEASGSDVWFLAHVPAGEWLNVSNSSAYQVAIQIVDGCDTGGCLAAGVQGVYWENTAGEGVDALVVVEGMDAEPGALLLTFDTVDIPPTLFGPDAYGYWGATDHDISMCPDIRTSGTPISLDDDAFAEVDMGTTFTFYGEAWGSVWVSSNGILTFGQGTSTINNQELPTPYTSTPAIAAYWDDLDPTQGGGIYHATFGDQVVVQWNVPPFGGDMTDMYDVRVVLDAVSGAIHVCYVDTEGADPYQDLGVSATAGIQGSSVTGLTYSYNQPALENGLHVWYSAP